MTRCETMITMLIGIAAVGISQAQARPQTASDKPGYAARAEAASVPQTAGEVSPARAAAIHQCVEQGSKLLQKDWGVRQIEVESSCMAQHGQSE